MLNTEKNILKVTSPIHMAHAEDDKVEPVSLAQKLEVAAKQVSDRLVKLEVFHKKYRYGHLGSHKDRTVIDRMLEPYVKKRAADRRVTFRRKRD